jgi:hypothetical protein
MTVNGYCARDAVFFRVVRFQNGAPIKVVKIENKQRPVVFNQPVGLLFDFPKLPFHDASLVFNAQKGSARYSDIQNGDAYHHPLRQQHPWILLVCESLIVLTGFAVMFSGINRWICGHYAVVALVWIVDWVCSCLYRPRLASFRPCGAAQNSTLQ